MEYNTWQPPFRRFTLRIGPHPLFSTPNTPSFTLTHPLLDPQVNYFIENLHKKDTLEPKGYETAKKDEKEPRSKGPKGKGAAKEKDKEREAADKARKPPSGRVVVVGAGPAGLAAASALKVCVLGGGGGQGDRGV